MYYEDSLCDELINYNNILISVKNLYKKLEIKDSFEIFYTFSYMLHNGYFSVNKRYEHNINKRIINSDHDSLSIMTGYGVCVNNSDMLYDIYNKLNYNPYMIANFCNKLEIDRYDLRKRIIIKEDLNKIPKNIANHVCVLVKDNKYNLIYDSTNIGYFKINNLKEAYIINGEGKIKIKLFESSSCYNQNKNELCRVISEILEDKENKINYLKKVNKILNKCKNNKDLFEQFYMDNKNDIDYISKQVTKRR